MTNILFVSPNTQKEMEKLLVLKLDRSGNYSEAKLSLKTLIYDPTDNLYYSFNGKDQLHIDHIVTRWVAS